jgi:hypothetical protein
MVPPHLLLGCTLLFWGWQSQLLLFSLVMATVLELSRWSRWRITLTEKDFNKLADLSSLLLVVAAIYLFSREAIHGLFTLLNWLPILLFPLITAQAYSHFGSVKLSSLFVSLRYSRAHTRRAQQRINLNYPYLLIIVLATSVTYHAWFFTGVCLLTLLALWQIRPQRYSVTLWLAIVSVTLVFAYVNQQGLYHLQTYIENIMVQWFDEMLWANRDPYRQTTAIGDIGELKQSNRIILRVVSPAPILLREASYNSYFKKTWRAKEAGFTAVAHDPENRTLWSFAPPLPKKETIRISTTLNQGQGMLSLPSGTYQLSHLPVLNLQRNHFGAIKVEEGPEFIEYQVHFGEGSPLDTQPTEQDLMVPAEEKAALEELVTQLQLRSQPPQQVITTLQDFFQQQFGYSLNLAAPTRGVTPLENFLRYQHAGHCEYFATATALLLRMVGIPSRYVAGYAVEEFSSLEQAYIVRKRHAHAWTLAYLHGQWQNIDNTPPTWSSLEQKNASWWQPLYDLWAWINYHFVKWRWQNTATSHHWLAWFIIPLGLALAWRLYFGKKVSKVPVMDSTTFAVTQTPSEFFKIAQYLTEKGYLRLPGETLHAWFDRIHLPELEEPEIRLMLTLHRRHRFDPEGTTAKEQILLIQQVKSWLKKRAGTF